MKFALQKLLVAALILAWISPACATRAGGYTLMEICGAFGMKTVAVPADQASAEQHQKAAHDCAFCFASTFNMGLKTAPVFIAVPALPQTPDLQPGAMFFASASAARFPRGPPVSFA